MLPMEAFFGLFQGFLNVDLENPLFCVTDGITVVIAMVEVYIKYFETQSNDVYQNFYDISLPLQYNCNPISTGGVGAIAVYLLTPTIKSELKAYGLNILLLPLFCYFAIQWYNDITIGYDAWTFRYANHYDFKNLAYIIGKIASSAINFMSFFEYVRDVQVNPLTW